MGIVAHESQIKSLCCVTKSISCF